MWELQRYIWIIQDLTNFGVGSQVKMGASQRHHLPANWSIIDYDSKVVQCETGGYRNNIAVIKRLR
jgi:hypothetical protein